MRKMIDKRFFKSAAIFVAYLASLLPLYFIVGIINLKVGLHLSYQFVCMIALVVAITITGNIYRKKDE